jgi:hypothetical protein
MCDCYWFNGDSCSYEDRASGQTEDGYCEYEDEGDASDCDSYTTDEEMED